MPVELRFYGFFCCVKIYKRTENNNERWNRWLNSGGVKDELKMKDQMEWGRRINNIKIVAEESVLKIIYS